MFGTIGRSVEFGTYCCELVILLFSRVTDLHNFEIVLSELEPMEVAAVYARIGILNIFNPMKPETSLELNLERQEDRVMTKMIVLLSAEEPGINLTYKQFQWKRDLDPTPGWYDYALLISYFEYDYMVRLYSTFYKYVNFKSSSSSTVTFTTLSPITYYPYSQILPTILY